MRFNQKIQMNFFEYIICKTYKSVKTLFYLILIATGLLNYSCTNSKQEADISDILVDMKFFRFDSSLYVLDPLDIEKKIPSLENRYGKFYDLFNYELIQIGGTDNPAYSEYFRSFLTDYVVNQSLQKTHEEFSDINWLKNDVTKAFRYYKYYFPEKQIPDVYTFITGFNNSIVTAENILGIGLDKYLGSDYDLYPELGFPLYKIRFMIPEKIPVDCMRGWVISEFPLPDSTSNLLSNLIYQGKILYISKLTMPEVADTLLFGFTGAQMNFVNNNEKQMWSFLVENKLLFSTDYLIISKYVNEGPFTREFTRESPGQAVNWIGYKITGDYMNNSGASIEALMNNNDYTHILAVSKYNP